jgi:hypothetical protein
MNTPGHPRPGWRYFVFTLSHPTGWWAYDTTTQQAYWVEENGRTFRASISLQNVLGYADMPEVTLDPDYLMDEGL